MAAQQFTIEFTPDLSAIKKDVVISTPLVDPTTNQIWVGFGTTVPTRRGTEIATGLRWLVDGIKDRNLIDRDSPDFKGSIIVSAVSIDQKTESDRRTSSGLVSASAADIDLVVAMGVSVTTLEYRNIIDNAFEVLIRAVQEWLYKNG
jgi:hypothetical protein